MAVGRCLASILDGATAVGGPLLGVLIGISRRAEVISVRRRVITVRRGMITIRCGPVPVRGSEITVAGRVLAL